MKAKGMKTKGDIFAAAVECAKTHGLYNMTRTQVAKVAKTATGTVSFHFTDMVELRREVVRHCIKHPSIANMKVFAAALVNKDSIAVRAPAELKREALQTLA